MRRCSSGFAFLVLVAVLALNPIDIFAQTLWTIDGGGVISTEIKPEPKWQSGRIQIDDQLDAALQLRQDSGTTVVNYNLGGSLKYDSEREFTGDLTRLNAQIAIGGFPGSAGIFGIDAGRLQIADPTMRVIDQPGDGFSLTITRPGFEVGITAAYFGLLLKHTNQARFLAADVSALSDPSIILAPPRGLGMIRSSFPRLVLGTDVTLWGFYLTDFADPASVRRWYAGTTEGGPVWGPFSQQANLIVSADIGSALSLLGSAAIVLDLSRSVGLRSRFEATYASGDGGGLSAFVPLTGTTNGVILAQPDQNLLMLRLDGSILPFRGASPVWLQSLETFVSGTSYFKPASSPPTAVGYDPAGTYYGTEVESGLRYQRGTDPSFSLSGGLFADAAGGLQWFGHLLFSIEF